MEKNDSWKIIEQLNITARQIKHQSRNLDYWQQEAIALVCGDMQYSYQNQWTCTAYKLFPPGAPFQYLILRLTIIFYLAYLPITSKEDYMPLQPTVPSIIGNNHMLHAFPIPTMFLLYQRYLQHYSPIFSQPPLPPWWCCSQRKVSENQD